MNSKLFKTKNLILLALVSMLINLSVYAQAPQAFKYQALATYSNGTPIANQLVSFRINLLQGSTSGTSVYSETHAITTNAEGLVNLEIGNGSGSGNMNTVDWANGPYFIKVEMDTTGGSNYILMGTSQLLSVPYALYAEKAGTTSGHYVGELFGGGIVFWVSPDGQHGLIASLYDLDGGTGYIWSNVDSVAIGTSAQSLWDGLSNSNAIVAQTNHTSSAAQLCFDYSNEGFDDWYLPSIRELIHLASQSLEINYVLENDNNVNSYGIALISAAPTYTAYWSSTESSAFGAKTFILSAEYLEVYNKNYYRRVRAIRKF